ncbi:SDR family oxidoreductase [Pseudomonas granadensis]|uniref:SDR family oxidoreductase n=1 Tax=Pseudomonas granadensis TaxID=1421430 RepID=A0ABX7GCJ1_9PSED|nr:SDR family oxidoreductase [Pseudomonas granadensis]MBN6775248.1 SDR family oxidoreductase [Pseudomonas granadensis]MBN6806059.1 SDR family oxidoreductase [Pseudomonas granadensis]MBN6833300.1 SDR family oxidoreductase [Pseudomonas granadensis]MBN6840576.1 SDR family oxidoreductase [Pseudomonas granadensis]MBN6869697.1 SDR family oxidoreductase [Pseudomonas granadensis]
MTKRRVLVTGATGFVGEAVVFRILLDKVYAPVAAVRGESRLSGLCDVVPFDLSAGIELPALVQIDTVVHCAARVHVMSDSAADPLAKFREINVQGAVRLAHKAAESGVRRFVFISSIKVNGEATLPGMPFKADDQPAPVDPYGVSKCEAEERLREIGRETGMEIVIIRPPLVYGPGVKANFLSMMNWLRKGLPLPLGALRNQRSLVALGNLVDLIVTCIEHPAAANQTFLVSDGEDLSTTRLLRRMAAALDKRALLLPLPQILLQAAAQLMGKGDMAQRLCGSLQVDIDKTRLLLQWSPPVSVDKALKDTAMHYLNH